jgi:hypothetical protein
MSRVWIFCKKTFSLALIFNALLTIACAVGLLGGFYWFFPGWKPFHPYLFDGNVLWIVIAAAALNIFPSALIGRHLKTGRFLFHHYVYGFLVLAFAAVYVIAFTPVPLATIFLVNNTSVPVNAGRFFLLGGFTLVLDDLPDVSKRIESALNRLKVKAHRGEKFIAAAQLFTGAASLGLFGALCLGMSQVARWVTPANFILIFTVLITGVTSLVFVKRRAWLNITAANQEEKG